MGPRQARTSVPARVTYLLEPKNWLIVTVIAVGVHADGLAGPAGGAGRVLRRRAADPFIDYGIRRGRFDDRNVGARRPRLVVLAFITTSVATGLILLLVLAPRPADGYLAFMLVSVAVLAAITMVWKISIHCAVASGSVTILALAYGPLVLAVTCWSGCSAGPGWRCGIIRPGRPSAARSSARRRPPWPTRPSYPAGENHRQRPYRLRSARDPLGQADLAGSQDQLRAEPQDQGEQHRDGRRGHGGPKTPGHRGPAPPGPGGPGDQPREPGRRRDECAAADRRLRGARDSPPPAGRRPPRRSGSAAPWRRPAGARAP